MSFWNWNYLAWIFDFFQYLYSRHNECQRKNKMKFLNNKYIKLRNPDINTKVFRFAKRTYEKWKCYIKKQKMIYGLIILFSHCVCVCVFCLSALFCLFVLTTTKKRKIFDLARILFCVSVTVTAVYIFFPFWFWSFWKCWCYDAEIAIIITVDERKTFIFIHHLITLNSFHTPTAVKAIIL